MERIWSYSPVAKDLWYLLYLLTILFVFSVVSLTSTGLQLTEKEDFLKTRAVSLLTFGTFNSCTKDFCQNPHIISSRPIKISIPPPNLNVCLLALFCFFYANWWSIYQVFVYMMRIVNMKVYSVDEL